MSQRKLLWTKKNRDKLLDCCLRIKKQYAKLKNYKVLSKSNVSFFLNMTKTIAGILKLEMNYPLPNTIIPGNIASNLLVYLFNNEDTHD